MTWAIVNCSALIEKNFNQSSQAHLFIRVSLNNACKQVRLLISLDFMAFVTQSQSAILEG